MLSNRVDARHLVHVTNGSAFVPDAPSPPPEPILFAKFVQIRPLR
jgi:hypothetical protein